jgi:protein TonB
MPAAAEGKLQLRPVSEGFGKARAAERAGLAVPVLLQSKEPQYTSAAMRAKLQGTVEVQAVVLTDGTVGDVRITKSLDTVTGLDDQAVQAVKQWLFKPGELNGQPIPVIVTLNLTFRLH